MGSWRTPSTSTQLNLALDLWMLWAADHAVGTIYTTFTNWASRAAPVSAA